jgi:formylglycine-generating enzyme required for sulfatase activity
MILRIYLLLTIGVLVGVHQAAAQGTRFFRISGPAATTITAFNPDGTLVWSNARLATNYIVQTVSSLPGETNWVDYVQIPVTNGVNTNLIVAFNPPSGMALIPAGMFTIGGTPRVLEPDNTPTNATVSAIYMDINLVSYSQWQSVYNWATNNGYSFDDAGSGRAANHPVQTVDWYDVVKWSNARSQQAGLTPVYYTDAGFTQLYTNGDIDAVYSDWSANGYRLPTEAEWEKAARGGLSGQLFPWGNTISETQANYKGNTSQFSYDLGPNGYNAAFTNGVGPYTSPVGYFAPNGYGLYDMAGNVYEWCWDWYDNNLSSAGSPYAGGTDPHGPASSPYNGRVFRGGVWSFTAGNVCCAIRSYSMPLNRSNGIGFRCVRGL